MVVAIDTVLGARDDIRAMMAQLNAKSVDLHEKQQMMEDREESFMKAVHDLQEFANRFYGPDSELAQFQSKITRIEERLDGVVRDVDKLKRKVG